MGKGKSNRQGKGNLPPYVLITPAWNEAEFIEGTLKSMVAQTVPPTRWVIVSDGSTDGTDDIVAAYAARFPWIELLRLPERKERHFSGKVNAFNAGYGRAAGIPHEIVGNVDADITFGPDHFEFLLERFAAHPGLGVAGTAYTEGSELTYDYRIVSVEDVAGACQLFRRRCFEEIGGYRPMKIGGIDSVAVYAACMKGWKTRTFTEKRFHHHRKVGTAQTSLLASRFKLGQKDYYLGGHPLWEVLRAAYQMKKAPRFVGGCALMAGYLSLFLKGAERPLSPELVQFRRTEQMQRLKNILKRCLGLPAPPAESSL